MQKKLILIIVLTLLCVGCGKVDITTTTVASEDTVKPTEGMDGANETTFESTNTTETEEIIENVTDENTVVRFETFEEFAQNVLVSPTVVYNVEGFNTEYTSDIESTFKENDYAIASYCTTQNDITIVGQPNYYGKIEGIILSDIENSLNTTNLHYTPSLTITLPVSDFFANELNLEYQLMNAETAQKEITMWGVQVENFDITNAEGNIRFIDGNNIEFGAISDTTIGNVDTDFFALVTLKPLIEIDWDAEYNGDEEIGIGEIMIWQKVADDLYIRTELLANKTPFTYEQVSKIIKYLKVKG